MRYVRDLNPDMKTNISDSAAADLANQLPSTWTVNRFKRFAGPYENGFHSPHELPNGGFQLRAIVSRTEFTDKKRPDVVDFEGSTRIVCGQVYKQTHRGSGSQIDGGRLTYRYTRIRADGIGRHEQHTVKRVKVRYRSLSKVCSIIATAATEFERNDTFGFPDSPQSTVFSPTNELQIGQNGHPGGRDDEQNLGGRDDEQNQLTDWV